MHGCIHYDSSYITYTYIRLSLVTFLTSSPDSIGPNVCKVHNRGAVGWNNGFRRSNPIKGDNEVVASKKRELPRKACMGMRLV